MGLSRNIQNKGTGYSGQGAVKERDAGYMRDGMKKEKKTGSWVEDMGLQISDCGFRIVDIIKSVPGSSYKDTVAG